MTKHVFLAVMLGGACSCCSLYAGIPTYVVGSIPPQEVQQGTTLSFQLQSPKTGAATFAYSLDPASPSPQGQIALNPFSGLFTYSPLPADKFQFRVRVSSTVTGSSPDSQPVDIVPIASLPTESDLIQRTTAVPDPSSTDYLLVTQSQNGNPEIFNGTLRTTWNVVISGKSVIFDSGTPSYGGLYTRFHNRPDMKTLSIYAETLTIRAPLKLPGTNVIVFARYLRFEDTASPASIDTTASGYASAPLQFQNGSEILRSTSKIIIPSRAQHFA